MSTLPRVLLFAACTLAACGDNVAPRDASAPSGAVTIEVPDGAGTPPFDQPRAVTVPPGFGIRIVARVPKARFLAETPEGELLVSRPSTGEILRIVNGQPEVLASGLQNPHDLVFAAIGGETFLYVSEQHRISRARWSAGATSLTLEVVVSGLPDASLPELMGGYGHALKNIAITGDTLFVSIASATNADPSDILADPVRGAVYAYTLDGANRRLYATGIRNAEGLAIHPRTGDLWVAVNHRDNIQYPLRDGRFPYGEVVQEYVNDNPPEPFNRVREGANYGWPYCNPTAANGNDDMPYLPDVGTNEDEAVLDCDALDRIDKGLPAHSAPLGLSFWTGPNVPAAYRDSAVIGLHGCWNCSEPRGYAVTRLAMRADGSFEDPVDLVSGFLTDPTTTSSVWGRPVDVIPNRAGNLYISDDYAGAVYELYRR